MVIHEKNRQQGTILAILFALAALGYAFGLIGGRIPPTVSIVDLPGVQATLSMLADPSDQLESQNLMNPVPGDGFQVVDKPLHAMPANSPVWFRLAVDVPPSLKDDVAYLQVMPANLDSIRFFHADGREVCGGLHCPLSERDQGGVTPATKITLSGTRTLVLFRVVTSMTLVAYFTLLSGSALYASEAHHLLLVGISAGALMLTLVMNAFNWYWTRALLYYTYCCFVFLVLIQGLWTNGIASAFLFPERPEWVIFLDDIWPCLMGATAVFFSIQVLQLDQRRPYLAGICHQFGWIVVAGTTLAISPWWSHVQSFLLVALLLYGILTVYLSGLDWWTKGQPSDTWVFFAYLSFLVFQSITLLTMLGILPATFWSVQSWQLGTLVHLLLLHVVTAMRLQNLQRAHYLAERRSRWAWKMVRKERRRQGDLRRFLDLLAHELNTPLSMIDSTIQSLYMLPGAENPAVDARYRRIRTISRNLTELIRQSVGKEKLEAGDWQLNPELVDPMQVLDNVLVMRDLHLPDNGYSSLPLDVAGQPGRLELRLQENVPAILTDRQLLQVVLGNLLDNACKYSDAGSTITLVLAVGTEKESIVWRFINQSDPIPDTDLARLFDKYYRGKHYGGIPGIGLGLFLANHIAGLHGGTIKVSNKPSRRVCFELELPLRTEIGHA